MLSVCPLYVRVPLTKPSSRRKSTLITMGLLRNLDIYYYDEIRSPKSIVRVVLGT